MLKIIRAVYTATGGKGTFKPQWRVVEGCLTRWRIEETIRFVKQSLPLGDFRHRIGIARLRAGYGSRA